MTEQMTHRERFLAVCRGEKPDYVPIFGFFGAPGMSAGCMKKTHDPPRSMWKPGRNLPT